MKNVLVSIIIPVYNCEKYIKRSINSVLSQTHKHIEIIVVNDGSTDNTENVILEIKRTDSRIKYYAINNSGVSAARNIGLENATGKYVGFVDADDYIDNTMIETLLRETRETKIDLVSCTYVKLYPEKNINEEVGLETGYYSKEDLENHVLKKLFYNKNSMKWLPLNIVTKLFKNEVIKKNSLKFNEKLKFGEDLIFTRRFLLNSENFYFIDSLHLYKYVHNEKSMTNGYYPNKWKELRNTMMANREIVDEYPQYNLESQHNLAVLYSVLNAINNVFKNKKNNNASKIRELVQIIEDPLVRSTATSINLNELNTTRKFLIYLVKRRKIKSIFVILTVYNILFN